MATKRILETFSCGVCGKSFNRKSNLRTHLQTHNGDGKPFQCDLCDNRFTRKTGLDRHLLIHTGEKTHKCDVCGKAFSNSSGIAKHARIHTGEKPFKCDICGNSFTQKTSLTQHNRIHTGEMPFECHMCDKKFRNKGNLTIHIRIHTGEKLFKCDTCLKAFNKKSDLTRHTLTHTKGKLFQCDICEEAFNIKRDLNQHLLVHSSKYIRESENENVSQNNDLQPKSPLCDSKESSPNRNICDEQHGTDSDLQKHIINDDKESANDEHPRPTGELRSKSFARERESNRKNCLDSGENNDDVIDHSDELPKLNEARTAVKRSEESAGCDLSQVNELKRHLHDAKKEYLLKCENFNSIIDNKDNNEVRITEHVEESRKLS